MREKITLRGRAPRIAVGIITLAVLLLAGSAGAATLTVNASGGADYTRIQDAINNANAGDTILVYSGSYFENVNVNKQLILRGIDSGGGKPVVDSRYVETGIAIALSADGITLDGFNVRNGTNSLAISSTETGIYVGSTSNIIKNTNASFYDVGIYLSSSNNMLSGNNASNNFDGIYLYHSSNNTLSDNAASNNINSGINLYYSSNNTLSSNNLSNNTHGISLYHSSNNNTLSGNTANSNNGQGINLDGSNNNTLSDNNASHNFDGIYLSLSSNNTLSGNIANSNNNIGIVLEVSNNNTIYNNYFNNTNNSIISDTNNNNNIWNTTRTIGKNIIGGPYLGGNFWANPNGTGFSQTCADGDGICDSPYALDSNNIDYLPLAYKPNIPDAIPPVINNVTLNTTTPLTGQAILVTVNATDNVGVTSVKAITVGNFAVETSLTSQGGNIWNGTITAIEGNHSVNISTHDAAGNVAWDNSTSYTATAGPIPPAPELNTAILTLTGIVGILFVSRKCK